MSNVYWLNANPVDRERRTHASPDKGQSIKELHTTIKILEGAMDKLKDSGEEPGKIDVLSKYHRELIQQLAVRPAWTLEDVMLKMSAWTDNTPASKQEVDHDEPASMLAASVYADLMRIKSNN